LALDRHRITELKLLTVEIDNPDELCDAIEHMVTFMRDRVADIEPLSLWWQRMSHNGFGWEVSLAFQEMGP
jgi:hypothetical protein